MPLTPRITFRHMESSPAVEDAIRKRVEALEHFYPGIVAAHVVFEKSHHRHRKGDLFHVRADVSLPGGTVAIGHEQQDAHQHEDAYVAIRDAFDALRRRIEDFARKQRGQTKTHAPAKLEGRVRQISWYEGFGFIEADGHADIYFHKNSVVSQDFEAMAVGDRVRFVLNEGESAKGPQASSVERISTHAARTPAPSPQ